MLNWEWPVPICMPHAEPRTRPMQTKNHEHAPCKANWDPCKTLSARSVLSLSTPRVRKERLAHLTDTPRVDDPCTLEDEHGPCEPTRAAPNWWARLCFTARAPHPCSLKDAHASLHGPCWRPVQLLSFCFLELCTLTDSSFLPELKCSFTKTQTLSKFLQLFHKFFLETHRNYD